ncbi:hypothetical protein ACHIPZ_19295 [Antrihabitans sp. NCIMB 15449]|uniref:Low molecular weight antigen MTB12-like C-terminal domain-containing protein n=1 Tax=Antrihabitans spumae TaxID=3373370 RepID=A0ABW7JR78_9NOCA
MTRTTPSQRKRQRALTVAVAGLCGTLLVTAAGCGSDVVDASSYSNDRSASPTSASYPKVPSAADLDALLIGALSRTISDDERIALIEDGEAFRSAIPDLYRAIDENPNARFKVVDPVFDNHDGTLTATFQLDKDGRGTDLKTAVVHFVASDGRWKISRDDLCGILRQANYRTQACG